MCRTVQSLLLGGGGLLQGGVHLVEKDHLLGTGVRIGIVLLLLGRSHLLGTRALTGVVLQIERKFQLVLRLQSVLVQTLLVHAPHLLVRSG